MDHDPAIAKPARWRRAAGFGLVVCAVAGAGAVISTGIAHSGSAANDVPKIESVATTGAPGPTQVPVAAGMSDSDARKAEQIALQSSYVAKIAGGADLSVDPAETAPVTGVVEDPSFAGAGVIITFARAVEFPAGIPIFKDSSETGNDLPLADATQLSTDTGRLVTSVGVVVNLNSGDVIAVLPGAGSGGEAK
jgi:hypothetical protein